MKYWRVAVTVDALAVVYVEAETEEEAKNLGMELVDPTTAELADPIEVVEIEEVDRVTYERLSDSQGG